MKNTLTHPTFFLLFSVSMFSQSFIEKRITHATFINENCTDINKFSTSFQLLLKCLKHLNNEINIHEFEDLEEYYIYATPSRGSHYSGVVESCDFFLFDKNLDYTKGFKIRYFSTNSINIQKLMFESDSTDVNINPQNDSLSLSAIYIDKTQENYIRNVLIKFKSQNIDTLINEELLLTDSNQFEFGEFIFHIKDYGVTPIQAYFFNLYNKKYFFID